MPRIQNIIFDFGNVLFDLDLPAIPRELKRLLGDQYEPALARLNGFRLFELYETGGLSTQEFIDILCNSVQPPLRSEQVIDAWNAIFVGMPRHRFDLLLQLRQRYRIFLLSNINELHAAWIDAYMQREHGLTDFLPRYFDAAYYSHLIRLRKPDPEIYAYVLADAELSAAETLFVDDLVENVDAARNLGIEGVVKTPGLDIDRFMEDMLEQ